MDGGVSSDDIVCTWAVAILATQCLLLVAPVAVALGAVNGAAGWQEVIESLWQLVGCWPVACVCSSLVIQGHTIMQAVGTEVVALAVNTVAGPAAWRVEADSLGNVQHSGHCWPCGMTVHVIRTGVGMNSTALHSSTSLLRTEHIECPQPATNE